MMENVVDLSGRESLAAQALHSADVDAARYAADHSLGPGTDQRPTNIMEADLYMQRRVL
jgi:hypothetical protein